MIKLNKHKTALPVKDQHYASCNSSLRSGGVVFKSNSGYSLVVERGVALSALVRFQMPQPKINKGDMENMQVCRKATVRALMPKSPNKITRPKQFPVVSQKWSMEDINSTCPHCKREICKQSDPTSTETDSIPYGTYTKMFAGLIIGNSYYSITKKRVLKKMKGSLVVCLS